MASLKALKMRITSVKSTQKITKAMKMVAAAKLRRAQEAAEAARPYSERMAAVHRLAREPGDRRPRIARACSPAPASDQVHLLVVASSERGLAGGFNTNIARLARRTMDAAARRGEDGQAAVRRQEGPRAVHADPQAADRRLSSTRATSRAPPSPTRRTIAADITRRFEAGEFDVAHLFFARFRSALVQEPTEIQLIPAALPAAPAEAVVEAKPSDAVPAAIEYEPDEEAILAELLPRNLSVQIFRALLENAASEQGSRMTAMDNATRNAGEMITKLTITYNRTRQAAITKELIEIISGAEAL